MTELPATSGSIALPRPIPRCDNCRREAHRCNVCGGHSVKGVHARWGCGAWVAEMRDRYFKLGIVDAHGKRTSKEPWLCTCGTYLPCPIRHPKPKRRGAKGECRNCKRRFVLQRSTQVYCNFFCNLKWTRRTGKAKRRLAAKIRRANRAEARDKKEYSRLWRKYDGQKPT